VQVVEVEEVVILVHQEFQEVLEGVLHIPLQQLEGLEILLLQIRLKVILVVRDMVVEEMPWQVVEVVQVVIGNQMVLLLVVIQYLQEDLVFQLYL